MQNEEDFSIELVQSSEELIKLTTLERGTNSYAMLLKAVKYFHDTELKKNDEIDLILIKKGVSNGVCAIIKQEGRMEVRLSKLPANQKESNDKAIEELKHTYPYKECDDILYLDLTRKFNA